MDREQEDVEHESGFRHGPVTNCDYEGCDCSEFGLVRDRLTGERLVVCYDCGFTMGYL